MLHALLTHLPVLPPGAAPQATVRDLKQRLVRPTGLPVQRQRVIYRWVLAGGHCVCLLP